jgi:hypothetical protein
MCPSPQDHGRDRDDDPDTGDEGQVSETAAMTPGGGEGDTPGTDDGVPPAGDSHIEPGGGPPKSYGD